MHRPPKLRDALHLRHNSVYPLSRTWLAPVFLSSLWLLLAQGPQVQAATVEIRSNATWRATSTPPSDGWNSSTTFDDSDAAGWEFAFKSPAGNNIWIGSNLSSEAPDQAWFRYEFTLEGPVTSAKGLFNFDDDGEAYINGVLVALNTEDSNPGTLNLSPTLFRVGENVVAMHGVDTRTPFNNVAASITLTTVPEPSAGLLFAACAALLGSRRCRPHRIGCAAG